MSCLGSFFLDILSHSGTCQIQSTLLTTQSTLTMFCLMLHKSDSTPMRSQPLEFFLLHTRLFRGCKICTRQLKLKLASFNLSVSGANKKSSSFNPSAQTCILNPLSFYVSSKNGLFFCYVCLEIAEP